MLGFTCLPKNNQFTKSFINLTQDNKLPPFFESKLPYICNISGKFLLKKKITHSKIKQSFSVDIHTMS